MPLVKSEIYDKTHYYEPKKIKVHVSQDMEIFLLKLNKAIHPNKLTLRGSKNDFILLLNNEEITTGLGYQWQTKQEIENTLRSIYYFYRGLKNVR